MLSLLLRHARMAGAGTAAGDVTAAASAASDAMKCIHCSALGGDIDEVRQHILHAKRRPVLS